MCDSYKLALLIHKLIQNRAAGENDIFIFAERITYADPRMCFCLSNLPICV